MGQEALSMTHALPMRPGVRPGPGTLPKAVRCELPRGSGSKGGNNSSLSLSPRQYNPASGPAEVEIEMKKMNQMEDTKECQRKDVMKIIPFK